MKKFIFNLGFYDLIQISIFFLIDPIWSKSTEFCLFFLFYVKKNKMESKELIGAMLNNKSINGCDHQRKIREDLT